MSSQSSISNPVNPVQDNALCSGIENRNSKLGNLFSIVVFFVLSALLFWLVLSPGGASAARRAESKWSAVTKLDTYLAGKDWQGTNAEFAELIRTAQAASNLQPGNIEYRHWLNVYRWRLVSSYTDPATGQVVIPKEALAGISRLSSEFLAGLNRCPTFGQSWSMAGQLIYFVIAPAGQSISELSANRSASDSQIASSGMNDQAGLQKLASKEDMGSQPAAAEKQTSLNHPVHPVNPVYTSSQSPISNIGKSLILTGFRLAPCDATVCFVAGLLDVAESQTPGNSQSSSNSQSASLGMDDQAGLQKIASKEDIGSQPAAAEQQTSLNNPANPVKNSPSPISNSTPGLTYFSRCIQLNASFYPDCAGVYLGIDRPDLAVALAGQEIGFLTRAAAMLAESDAHSALAGEARAKVTELLELKALDPGASAGTLASLAAVYAKDGKTNEAVELYTRALALDYGNIGWRLNLARLLAATGKTEEAIREAKIVLRLKPGYAPAKKMIEDAAIK
jgi:hypothetical protein